MHLSIGISCRHGRKAEFFSFEKNAVPRTKKFRHTVIYALDHRDFMQTSRRPPRSAIFGPKACGFHGNGHLSPRDRNVDVFDEHRESTNGNISVPLLLMPLTFSCDSHPACEACNRPCLIGLLAPCFPAAIIEASSESDRGWPQETWSWTHR